MAPNTVDTNQPSTVKKENVTGLLDHPLVKEFGIPLLKAEIKKSMGIETHEKEITKRAFGRFMYALRDFIQGTFWVFLISMFVMMMTFVFFLWIRKVLGV